LAEINRNGGSDSALTLGGQKKFYNEARTHLSLLTDAPIPGAVQTLGQMLAMPIWAGCTTNVSEAEFRRNTAPEMLPLSYCPCANSGCALRRAVLRKWTRKHTTAPTAKGMADNM
jgi:hypothetical protein